MACLARSIQLPYEENVGLCSISQHNFKRWSQGRNPIIFQDVLRMKMTCRERKLPCIKLIGVPGNIRRSKLGNSGVVSCRLEENSSDIIANAGMPKKWSPFVMGFLKVTATVASTFLIMSSAEAADALKTCACLLKECRYHRPSLTYSDWLEFTRSYDDKKRRLELFSASENEHSANGDQYTDAKTAQIVELAQCIANPSCAANIACLQTCNNRADETECQIKCGDLFENSIVDQFNECAVSRKKCVPRKSDVGEFPVPDPSVLVKKFNLADFNGKWYISSGLNPTFDTFDCQLHEFRVEDGKLIGNLTWRIKTPDGGFFTRSAVQRFVQDPVHPGIMYNHDNEYLHYQDDWYILSSKVENQPDDYIFVYYRGRNDAWDGYGGAVVYTRSKTLPENIVPELERAVKSVGRDFSKFIRTDNTCGPEPPLVERIEKTVEEGERAIIREVEQIEEEVEKVGKTELTLLQRLAEGFEELKKDEENFLRGLSKEEMELLSELKMGASQVEELFGRALPLRKLR
ncbi:hypothetical protein Cgig2_019146 [Carnegiea gigantea]|uniref:VDE lipocalin domain-containing protein n=1 Tax=Carnegiea gigantea TaxID=171969 RepID=A0A9Q1Q6Q2_9CARY|nr:hypothetical protein Cgig2_019146 [Carnegiea gigantea]